ncbi:PREDICTED: TPR-containing protein DDB_G0280363 isoform X2 [Ceratosolen solmsi marchali]|nr:PREDICTED: TPR-containing protein DDB_G0280363 isoform X2 [Ceratosolen solmsi marchali]
MRGGMELNPPRSQDKNTRVFAVIANPEVLRIRGKNAKNQNDQSNLIEMLLNFVESKNKGVIFSRIYSILKDRDITGELKEVWNVIQKQENQIETWIDGQPPTLQYSQHLDQQQQQQQQLQLQQSPQPIPQQIQQQQQQIQQAQHIIQNSYLMSQPPQYRSNVLFSSVSNNECSNYDRYNYSQQGLVPVHQNEQVYQANSIITRPYNNNNGSRIDLDCYNYRERDRSFSQQSVSKQQLPLPQQQQQNCPAYSASQYHYQSIPRPMMHFMSSNVNSNYTGQMNPIITSHFSDYFIMQHQHMSSGIEQRQMENQIHAEVHRMQHQQQQEQMHLQPSHIQQPMPHYPTHGLNIAGNPPIKTIKRAFSVPKLQHVAGSHKNSSCKRQNNSPSHSKQMTSTGGPYTQLSRDNSADNAVKPKSPVKVLQRDPVLQNKHNVSQCSAEKNVKSLEKNIDENYEACKVQITDLDEDNSKNKNHSETIDEITSKEAEALNYIASPKETKDMIEYIQETKTLNVVDPTLCSESLIRELKEVCHHHNEKQRPVKTVLKRNKSCANDVKVWTKDIKGTKNGIKINFDQINSNKVEWFQDRNTDEHLKGIQHNLTELDEGWNVRVKHKPSDSQRRAQSTVNSIIKSVFKIHQGNHLIGDDGTGKKQKSNGQLKVNAKISLNEQEEITQGYTILKKSDVTKIATTTMNSTEVVTNEIAQLTIQDCKNSTEKKAVFLL